MATKDFAHLHVHTEYSMLDGAARLGDLFSYAKELGMSSMATSDHGFLFGAFDFWRQAKAHDIKPIIGVEAYLTPGTHRTDRSRVRWGDGSRDDVSGGGAYTHMTMWAETTEGMHNLFRASSIASLEGQLYKPRMDRDVLQTYSKGLIATTGCPSGEIPDAPAPGPVRRGAAGRQRLPRYLRQGQLLLRGHGPRPRHRT